MRTCVYNASLAWWVLCIQAAIACVCSTSDVAQEASGLEAFGLSAKFPCTLVEANRLLYLDDQHIGAPVKAVTWFCNKRDNRSGYSLFKEPLAAVVGREVDGADVRVYTICGDRLVETARAARGKLTLSASWCTIGGQAYLAVGGVGDSGSYEVEVFSLTPLCQDESLCSNFALTRVGVWKHGAAVNTIAWLRHPLGGGGNRRVLAIGGQASPTDGCQVRLLEFNATAQKLSGITGFLYGAPVYTLSWYEHKVNGRYFLAIAGGEGAFDVGVTVRILSLDPGTMEFLPFAHTQTPCTRINTLAWHSWHYPLLVAGGSYDGFKIGEVQTLMHYKFIARSGILLPYYHACGHDQSRSVLALDFLTPRQRTEAKDDICPYLAVGSALTESGENQTCASDVSLYRPEKSKTPLSACTAVVRTDCNSKISSLAWCALDAAGYAYLLVGSEGSSCVGPDDVARCPELVLYKGHFEPEGHKPELCRALSVGRG